MAVVEPLFTRAVLSDKPSAIDTTVPSGLVSISVLFVVSAKPLSPGEFWTVIALTIVDVVSTGSEKVKMSLLSPRLRAKLSSCGGALSEMTSDARRGVSETYELPVRSVRASLSMSRYVLEVVDPTEARVWRERKSIAPSSI